MPDLKTIKRLTAVPGWCEPELPAIHKGVFNFMGLPGEVRNLVYEYTRTPTDDPEGARVTLIHQKPGEYRNFTGLHLVCKAIYNEYPPYCHNSDTRVTIYSEHVGAYINKFYPTHGGQFEGGDIRIIYTAYGNLGDASDGAVESPPLNLSQLFDLQQRYDRLKVSFICYILTNSREKPVFWPRMTEDFNTLLCAQEPEYPELSGDALRPTDIARYFANSTDKEISVISRWFRSGLGALNSMEPAIVLNVKFKWNCRENRQLPFATMMDAKSLSTVGEILWSIDELIRLPRSSDLGPETIRSIHCGLEGRLDGPFASEYTSESIMGFIWVYGLDYLMSRHWYINFQPADSQMRQLNDPKIAAQARVERLLSPYSEMQSSVGEHHGEEIPAVFQDLLVEAGYTRGGADILMHDDGEY